MTVLEKRIKRIEILLKSKLSYSELEKLKTIAHKNEPFYKLDNYFKAVILNTEEQKSKEW